jgi:cytochrome c peroxidase
MPVHLTELDRGRSAATFDQMAQSIAGYEASAEVTLFTSSAWWMCCNVPS